MLVTAYEKLRAEAGSSRPEGEPGWGRALLLHRGLAAWLSAWSRVSPSAAAPRCGGPLDLPESGTTSPGTVEERPLFPPVLRAEAVAVLAGMALAHGRR